MPEPGKVVRDVDDDEAGADAASELAHPQVLRFDLPPLIFVRLAGRIDGANPGGVPGDPSRHVRLEKNAEYVRVHIEPRCEVPEPGRLARRQVTGLGEGERIDTSVRIDQVVRQEGDHDEIGREGQPVVLEQNALRLGEETGDAGLDDLDLRMVSRACIESVLEDLQVGVLECGPAAVGEAVTESEDTERARGLGQLMVHVTKAEAIVAVLEAELALRAGRSDAERERLVGEVPIADRLHVLRRQAGSEAEKAHPRLQSAGAGRRHEDDVEDESSTQGAAGRMIALRRHTASSPPAPCGESSPRHREPRPGHGGTRRGCVR